ncbi:MAG: hypothetical protein V1827_00020 [Candidatus Micrarchaeota archaeon]
MYDYEAEQNGRKLRFLIRIEHYVTALMSDYRKTEHMYQKMSDDPKFGGKEWEKRQAQENAIWERRIKEVEKCLDKFGKLMCTTDKTYQEADRECFNFIDYEMFADCVTLEGKRIDETKPRKRPKKSPEKRIANANLYLESELSRQKQEKLLGRGYKRLKISPFGDSGAAYYWLKTRYNEGKEHAFFCYLIESELKRHIRKLTMNINNGPDLEFQHKGKRFCFDVETGKKLQRDSVSVDLKYSKYKKEYDHIYVLVTRKSLRYKYSKYGTVLTRGKLKETISKIFD